MGEISSLDPVTLARLVEERYRRYLTSTFYFKDPELRRSFAEALESGRLCKGPFLEATPVFKRGSTPGELFPRMLDFAPDEGFTRALDGDRPLYAHQQLALEKVCSGRNVVVATGTGSGKTEAFLYPILLHLYRESRTTARDAGVRALVLYPMNALATDQRERLGAINGRFRNYGSQFSFSFGQYIGESPEDISDSRRQARELASQSLPGELVLRSQMRATPPDILLTNYSMLEYLLLRPEDSQLFDAGRGKYWTFLVLDEAHQYRGARGIEMAMLIRRLKQRVREGGSSGLFRCIATSASLIGDSKDSEAVARFATDLFGESFEGTDVVIADVEEIRKPSDYSLSYDDYVAMGETIGDTKSAVSAGISHMAAAVGATLSSGDSPEQAVGRILLRDRRSTEFRRRITEQPEEVDQLAASIFEECEAGGRGAQLTCLVNLLLRATDPRTGARLLSARYHLFLRSLEGAFVTFWPRKRVLLDRHGNTEGAAFELALCRQCGQHYLVGLIDSSKHSLVEAVRDPSDMRFGASFFRPLEDAFEATTEDEEGDVVGREQRLLLCTKCARLANGPPSCGHDTIVSVVKEKMPKDEDRADQLIKCGACGYRARDPVREVVHGTDGPHAVIATTLYQALPVGRKKLLAFADGRQEAAFFAWYLDKSYRDILYRNLLLRGAEREAEVTTEGLSLRSLAAALLNIFRERRVFEESRDEAELRKHAWLGVYREFLTEEPRISLEGVGLLRWSVKLPSWIRVPRALTDAPRAFSTEDAHRLLCALLESLRADKAVELIADRGVNIAWSDLELQGMQRVVRIGAPKGNKRARSWDSRPGRRARLVKALLMKRNPALSQDAANNACAELMGRIWDELDRSDADAPCSDERLLLRVDEGRRLNPNWWRAHLVSSEDVVYRCDVCGRINDVSIGDLCLRPGCPGLVRSVPANELPPDHYRMLYQEELPGKFRVEEHTAQLDREKARQYQRDFKEDRINVLSCSTTFELGVDLGNLDTVFLRNVPPEAYNYAQRVGRAGRRSEPGFAVTYCRRAPHDLYHFADPSQTLAGKARVPVLSLHNDKIVLRHVAATALSLFFRNKKDRFLTAEHFVVDFEQPKAAQDFAQFLREHQTGLERTLSAIIPCALHERIGLGTGAWMDQISGERSRLALAEAELCSDYVTVKRFEAQCSNDKDYRNAEWANERARTIAGEQVLTFLSRKAVIPKYGFPVDVVELDTQRTRGNYEATGVSLQRDLSIAISEFAPTNRLIANKKLWTSYAVKRVVGRQWPQKCYFRCRTHNVFVRWEKGQPAPASPCGCRLNEGVYIIPQFGFITPRARPEEPSARVPRMFTTRPYFIEQASGNRGALEIPVGAPVLRIIKASPGVMAVLCEGKRARGFNVCSDCGAGFHSRERSHKSPHGGRCNGKLIPVSLGHEFVTDVIQFQFLLQPPAGIEPVWFAFSLAFSLAEGAAELLEVPSNDLNATVFHSVSSPIPPIVLYDSVPGGAGLVGQLESPLTVRRCFEFALRRVNGNCGCTEETSCYGCLRSYRNQFAHQHLKRGPVRRFLHDILAMGSRRNNLNDCA